MINDGITIGIFIFTIFVCSAIVDEVSAQDSTGTALTISAAAERPESVPDGVVKAAFLSAAAHTCDYAARKSCYQHAIELCQGDRRRISRIVTEIATDRTNCVSWAIGVLSKYGTEENVPFLLGLTNDVRYCENVAHALLCIEGITEDTIRTANEAVKRNVYDSGEKYAICAAIARIAGKDGHMSDSRGLAVSSLKRYSREIPVTSLWADEFLLSLDPSYETSEDRKSLLHEVAARRLNDYQVEYATNALEKIAVLCRVQEERLQDLENICTCVESDDLNDEDVSPTPDDIIRKYNVTTNDVLRDLWSLSAKYSPSETNEEKRLAREMAFRWIGSYGGTNDLAQLATVMTNSADYAQEDALLASFCILKHFPELIPLVRSVVTNSCVYSAGLRGQICVHLLRLCEEGKSDTYINDPAQHARIAAFFLERAAIEQDEPLFIDRCAYTLNPSYRHSQQRRNNLAALRPPGLTGKRAELYDAAQADAAQED